jgi:Holliday junction resolvase RusA-like endonuclease
MAIKRQVKTSIGQNYLHGGSVSQVIEEPYILDTSRRFFLIDVVPMGKPRMTQSDKWKTNPNHPDPNKRQRVAITDYYSYKNRVISASKELGYEMNGCLDVLFLIPMPQSWSNKKKKRMDKLPHKQKPDVDNLVKALMDSLMKDDSVVWKTNVEKRWAYNGSIVIFH